MIVPIIVPITVPILGMAARFEVHA